MREVTDRRLIRWLTLLPLVAFLAVGAVRLWPRRTLVLWSCGGNYESLKSYISQFEAREGVRVRYTAAPAAFLLARALDCPSPPDVLVGRGGPGWDSLLEVGRCAGAPLVFAADPLVIAVACGNPKGIESVADLGRDGVRVSLSPGAMRPKSKVPGMFMAAVSEKLYPGLVERWENNAVVRSKCGRHLLAPLLDGRADAAIAPRSLLFYPEYRGKLEEVPIPAWELLSMKACPAIPQCAVALSGREQARQKLAERFVAGLAKETDWLTEYGYVPVDDARPLGPLLKAMAPKNMPGWQVVLAEKLAAAELSAETRRRYLKVVYTFGPNRYTARSLCRVATQDLAEGKAEAARLDWQRVLADYPPGQPVEYGLPTSPQKAKRQPLQALPYTHWREAATKGLREASGQPGEAQALDDPMVRDLFPWNVIQGDPPKNSTRDLALGLHLMVAGDYAFATRDLLKVVTLHYPSRHMPLAEYLLGVCAQARGYGGVARRQWERTVRDYPDTRAATLAKEALARLEPDETAVDLPVMPPWTESFGTHGNRGMTYGMRLYQHHLPLFAYKEMAKLLSGIYGAHALGGRARFCAGVACEAFGNQPAAVYQWRSCLRDAGKSPWAERARQALAQLGEEAKPLPGKPPRKPAKSGAGKRFRLAEEFFQAGIHEQGQVILEYLKVLTVARPPLKSLSPEARTMLGKAADHLAACLVQAGKSEAEARELARSIPGSRAFLKAGKGVQP
jgi:ABC-type molybdate transport system substrate-binding protein